MQTPRYLRLTIIVSGLAGGLWLATNLFLHPREAIHAAPLTAINVTTTLDEYDTS